MATVFERVRDIAADKLSADPDEIKVGSSFTEDLDADSLDIVQVLVALEDAYDIEIQEEELQEIKNMGDFIAYIERKAGEKGK